VSLWCDWQGTGRYWRHDYLAQHVMIHGHALCPPLSLLATFGCSRRSPWEVASQRRRTADCDHGQRRLSRALRSLASQNARYKGSLPLFDLAKSEVRRFGPQPVHSCVAAGSRSLLP